MNRMSLVVGIVIVLASARVAGGEDRVYIDEKAPADLEQLGIRGVVKTISYVPTTSDRYAAFRADLDQVLRGLHERGIAVVLEIVPGEAAQPLGRVRPYLNGKGVMLGGGGGSDLVA